ncbi:hypothetical protein [Rhodococcus sp. NPDC049939]|uniref:hypothetical protein n=1 Tax=Rhodococcus sp. NPDC049939 TaxID=3155511 RepID=UPI0033FBE8BB
MDQVAGAGALADRLRSYGFDLCSVSDKPPSELASDAITALLHKLDVSADSVDAVVYGTCSHRRATSHETRLKTIAIPIARAARIQACGSTVK